MILVGCPWNLQPELQCICSWGLDSMALSDSSSLLPLWISAGEKSVFIDTQMGLTRLSAIMALEWNLSVWTDQKSQTLMRNGGTVHV